MSQKKSKPVLTVDLIQAYLDLLEESVCLYSLDGRVEYCNPAHVKMFGYSADELIGLGFKDLPYLSADFSRIAGRLLEKIRSEGVMESIETQVKRKDNSGIWIETKVTLLRNEDKPFAIQTVTKDISERIESEQSVLKGAQNVRLLLDGLTDPLLIHMIPDKVPGRYWSAIGVPVISPDIPWRRYSA